MTSCVSVLLVMFAVIGMDIIVKGEIINLDHKEQSRRYIEAMIACKNVIESEPYPTSGLYCNRTWDKAMCWPDTPAGTTSVQPCANYLNRFDTSKNATRVCMHTGEWMINNETNAPWSNYTACTGANPTPSIDGPEIAEGMPEHIGNIVLIYNIGYGVSLVFLVVAVFIMLYFRKLRCQRNTIHVNLFVSFILRSAISFMVKNLLVQGFGLPQDVFYDEYGRLQFKEEGSHWECKLLFTVFHYILGANYMWVFVEGLYLYTLIFVAVFSENKRAYKWYIFGWVSPLAFVTPWVLVRIFLEDTYCWNTHANKGYYWIMKGPIVLSILVNFLFFLFIVWALFTKLRTSSRLECRSFQYRRLARSTLVLIPLFGAYYIVFICIPDYSHHQLELVKLYIESLLSSFQGFIVALLFCFLNGEVQAEVRKKFGLGSFPRRSNSGRSGTMSTVARASTVISTANDDPHHVPQHRSYPSRPTEGADDMTKLETMEMLPSSNGDAQREDFYADRGYSYFTPANGHAILSHEDKPIL